MADINYESTVRRVEKATGKQVNDFEVILFLANEVEQMRRKVKLFETVTSASTQLTQFRKATFDWILDTYEHMTGDEQRIFDLGELYGRLKAIEEDMGNADKK